MLLAIVHLTDLVPVLRGLRSGEANTAPPALVARARERGDPQTVGVLRNDSESPARVDVRRRPRARVLLEAGDGKYPVCGLYRRLQCLRGRVRPLRDRVPTRKELGHDARLRVARSGMCGYLPAFGVAYGERCALHA